MKIKRIIGTALCLLFCMSASVAAMAAEVSLTAAKTEVQVGDTIEVTVSVSGKSMAVVNGLFTYDPALLTYKESDGGAADGFINLVSAEKGGSSTLTGKIVFEAIGSGEATVDAQIESILNYDGEKLDGTSGTVKLAIAPAPPSTEPTPAPVDYSKIGVKAQNVTGVPSDMYIWKSLEDVTIPSKYTETEMDYHGETVMGATIADSNAPELLYLSDAAGENAAYYIYDRKADAIYPYKTISSVLKAYILLQPDSGVQAPEGFTQSTLTLDDKELTVWKNQDAQGDVYLVYGRDPQGEIGFYAYDPDGQSVQKYAVLPARPVLPELTPEPTAAPAEMPAETPVAEPSSPIRIEDDAVMLQKTVFFAVCGFGLLMFILFLVSVISHAIEKKRRRRRAAERRAAKEAEQKRQFNG